MMAEYGRGAALDIDSGSGVLHKEIRRRDIVSDHAANAHWIAQRSFIGAEMAHLIGMSQQGERGGGRLRTGEDGAECEKQQESEQRILQTIHGARRTHDCSCF
jgi:hypothetical protein